MATSPTTIIAYTSEDGRYDYVRQAAVETARSSQARLILYDIDAASMFESPLPNQWAAEGADKDFSDLLTDEDLERAGRHPIAEQVRAARAAGVETYAWLPQKKGADALAEYADKEQADLIMLPAEMEEPGLLDRLRGASVKKLEQETDRPIALVSPDGEVRYV